MNNDEKNVLDEEERITYDDLLFKYNESMNKISELESIIEALLYALRKANVERLVNKNEASHFQEMYAQKYKEANSLFEIVEKSNIDAYERKENREDGTY